MEIVRLDPDAASLVSAWLDMYEAVEAADPSDLSDFSRFEAVAKLRYGWPGIRDETWVAREGDHALGCYSIDFPLLDNTANADLEDFAVHPGARRRGIGRALFAHARERARLAGRQRLTFSTTDAIPDGPARDPAGPAFAAATGGQLALTEVRRRLDLKEVNQGWVDDALVAAWQRAAGYTLVQWRDAAPDDLVADVAALEGRFVSDAPQGGLEIEPVHMDAARFREIEKTARIRGRRTYHTGLRDDATGRLVAWTAVFVKRDVPAHAWQDTTLVDPAHYGRRLGTVAKLENLAFFREQENLTAIHTWNAAQNQHMIAINDAMGFRPVDAAVRWQLSLVNA